MRTSVIICISSVLFATRASFVANFGSFARDVLFRTFSARSLNFRGDLLMILVYGEEGLPACYYRHRSLKIRLCKGTPDMGLQMGVQYHVEMPLGLK